MKKFRIIAPALVALTVLLAGSAFIARADSHDDTFYACLYAGSLSQVNNNAAPANCGRGTNVSWEGNDEVGFNYTVERHSAVTSSTSTGVITPGPIVSAVALCDEGEVATGGGMVIDHGNGLFQLYASRGWDSAIPGPAGDAGAPDGWEVQFRNASALFTSNSVTAVAICTGTAVPS